jgi:phytoene dehydrogenase-like protein
MLRFSNDFALLESEVARAFPRETGAFERLSHAIDEHDPFDWTSTPRSARDVVRAHIGDPLLVEMLLEPVLYYGSATEGDIDWDSFVILFRSIFKEGLARPEGGVKRILDVLARRLRECGGELATRCGVAKIVAGAHGARGVALEDGRELEADHVFSSAGLAETLALCGREPDAQLFGRLSFVETITVMEKRHAELGHTATMTFFNTRERFDYRRPDALVDCTSGVICCSDNYRTAEPMPEGIQRVTVLADHDRWCALEPSAYAAAKARVRSEIEAVAARFAPSPLPHALLADTFTPRTIRHYTGHYQGAVYGSPIKRRDGSSGVANLHIIGTDQGLVGIVGAMLSGITMANRHALVERS